MDILPLELQFIAQGQTWAIVGDADSGHSEMLQRIRGKGIERVSFKHHFRNLSNTSDFYYQQRYNAADADDAQTVHEYLVSQQVIGNDQQWNYGRVIRELHLQELLSEQVIKLSNGETKRLLIAAALIRNPKVIVLDHPLTGLDKQTRNEFALLLDNIVTSGILVILATNPHEIPSPVTHVAVMKEGRIIFNERISAFDPYTFNFARPVTVDRNLLKDIVPQSEPAAFDTIVKMREVTVEYDGRKILSNINWHVKQGERWSLTGPNGAGKSTLLSLINGDNPQAYANNIILFDKPRGSGESIWDIKKHIGFVSPELYQYFPTDSTCLHVIESGFYDTVGLFRATDPEKEKQCEAWMGVLHVDQYRYTLFNRVPANVQRLCLLARALVKNPALLILDEPTQGLDEAQQQFFTGLIDQLCSFTRVTLICVSHYEHHIPRAVTFHLRLRNGRVSP